MRKIFFIILCLTSLIKGAQDQPPITLNPITYATALGSAVLNFLTPAATEDDVEAEAQDRESKTPQEAPPSYAQALGNSKTVQLNSTRPAQPLTIQPSAQIAISDNQQNGPRASFCKKCQSNCCDCLQITAMVTGACVVGTGACVFAAAACVADTALSIIFGRRTIIIVQEPQNQANK